MTKTESGSRAGTKRWSALSKKIPRTFFGGRVRTTTLLLIAARKGLACGVALLVSGNFGSVNV